MNGKPNHGIYKRVLLVFVMAVLCALFAVSASAETYGDFTYIVLEDGTIEITDYNGNSENVEIPSQIDEKNVTRIGEVAFKDAEINTLTIPSSINSIAGMPSQHDNAFYLSHIKEFVVDKNNMFFTTKDGVLFNKDMTFLVAFPTARDFDDYEVPASVKEISYHGGTPKGSYILGIKTLSFEKGTNIDYFNGGCFSFNYIEEVIIPPSVKMNNINFSDACIKKVSFESGRVGEEVFANVSSFWPIDVFEIPNTVTYISGSAFEKAKEITVFNPYCKIDITTNATIYGYEKSTAHDRYAHLGQFVAIDCDHSFGYCDWINDYTKNIATRECLTCYQTESVPLIYLNDENENIEIILPYEPDIDADIEHIIDHSDDRYILIEKQFGDKTKIVKCFDITLKNKDGVHVQPDGIVKVKLPLDWDKDGDYKVYRVNDDGTLTDMEAYREGSHMVFDTDHFSLYVIVDESPEQPEEPAESEENNSPFGFLTEIIRMFKELLNKIITFFQSIGDLT